MAGHWYMLLLVLLVSPTMVNTISRKEEGKMRHLREEKKKKEESGGGGWLMICLSVRGGLQNDIILCLEMEKIKLYATFYCLAVNFNLFDQQKKKRKGKLRGCLASHPAFKS